MNQEIIITTASPAEVIVEAASSQDIFVDGALTGPPGPTGPAGATGPEGPAGTPGSSGTLSGVSFAAYNASDEDKEIANVVCTGLNDDVVIQSYLDLGYNIYFSAGIFNLASPLAFVGDGTSDSATIRCYGQGNEKTFFQVSNNVNGFEISGSPKLDFANFCVITGGTGKGIVATAPGVAPYRGFWNSSFKNLFFKGDFALAGTGWAMDLQNPFRSTFENIEGNGVANGIRLSSTNANFNPGNCAFTRCFMALQGAPNGVAYELYTADTGGLFNLCTFIQCEGIDERSTSTSSIGWHLRGSSTDYYSTRNINIIQSNMEQFNTVVKLEHAVDNQIQLSYADTKTGGKIFDVSSDSTGNVLLATTGYVAPGRTTTFIADANTSTTQPNIAGGYEAYVDTGATLANTPSTSTILERLGASGPGTIHSSFVFSLTANRLRKVDISATAPSSGQVLTATGATTAQWSSPSAGSVAWGAITGTLSSQTDLQTALNNKADTSSVVALAAAL